MIKTGKRIISSILSAAMIFTAIPFTAATVSATSDIWDPKNGDSTSWYNAADTSFTIDTAAELAGLASLVNGGNNFSGKTLTLTTDIDLNNNNWTPIGKDSSYYFCGNFNGNNHTISNLLVSSAELVNLGLFGVCGSSTNSATISKIKIDNLSITSSTATVRAGGITGYLSGAISECSVKGTISCTGTNPMVGGIVGRVSPGTVTDCFSNANITCGDSTGTGMSTTSNAGGIAGFASNSSPVLFDNCYATGNITGGLNSNVGGLIGTARYGTATIKNCYATGNITTGSVGAGAGGAGGLIGFTLDDATGYPVVQYSYWNSDAIHTIAGTPQSTKPGVGTGTYTATTPDTFIAQTSDYMKTSGFVDLLNGQNESYTDWVAVTNDYPTFYTAPTEVTVTFDENGGDDYNATATTTSGGTVTLPTTAPTYSGKTFSGWNTAADGTGTEFTEATTVTADIKVYAQWTTIYNASLSSTIAAFDLNSDSPNHTDVSTTLSVGSYTLNSIKNGETELTTGINYTVSDNTYTFPISYLNSLTVGTHTITFDMSGGTDPTITITITKAAWTDIGNYDTSWYIGHESDSEFMLLDAADLAGLSVLVNGLNGVTAVTFADKTITLSNNIDLSGKLWTRIGYYDSCIFNGMFNGNGYEVRNMTIDDTTNSYQGLFGYIGLNGICKNLGVTNVSISASVSCIAAVAGMIDGSVDGCYASGSINSTGSSTGGIVGQNYGTVNNSYSSCTITSTANITAGVVGYDAGTLTNSYNTGIISGTNYVGGICGNSVSETGYTSYIYNCYNTGNITGTGFYNGGIVGCADTGSVTSCYSLGTATGEIDTYAAIGKVWSATVTKCYYLNTSETDSVDGTTYKTSEQFSSGEVAYLLGSGFGQEIGVDTYPAFALTDNKVYKVTINNDSAVDYYYTNSSYAAPTAPVKPSSLFKGWNNGAETVNAGSALTLSGDISLTAVWTTADSGLSRTFMQAKLDTETIKTIRCIATIDSLNYQEAGFVFSTSNSAPTLEGGYAHLSITSVRTNIKAGSGTMTVADLKGIDATAVNGNYMIACSISDITSYDTIVYATPYAIEKDGTVIYGTPIGYTYNDLL